MIDTKAQDAFRRIGWVVCLQLEIAIRKLYKAEGDCEASGESKSYKEGLDAAHKLIADRRDELSYGEA
jgi:hypothetical protein